MREYPEDLAAIKLQQGEIHVLMVGGGKGGLAMLDIFRRCKDLIHLDCIVDLDLNAPAMVKARNYQILTSQSIESSVSEFDGDIIVDVTGQCNLDQEIQRWKKRPSIEVISGNSARLLFDIVCHTRKDSGTIQAQSLHLNLLDSMLNISLKLEKNHNTKEVLQKTIQGIHTSLLARKSVAFVLDDVCQSFGILDMQLPEAMPAEFIGELKDRFQGFDERDKKRQYFEKLTQPIHVPCIDESFDLAIPLLIHGNLLAVLLIQLDGDISDEDKSILSIAAMHLRLTIKAVEDHQQLEAESIQDVLTDCYNRRYFNKRLEQEVARIKRLPKAQLGCMFFDLDHFKNINDLHGHQAGDDILKAVAKTIQHTLRNYDVFARFGGDEFIALLPFDEGLASSTPEKIAQRILKNIQAICIAAYPQLKVTVSIGLVTLKACQLSNGDALIQYADRAVYAAKNSGKNCVHCMTIEDE